MGAGTSKANTAILHTGFDTKPGTLESRLVRRGYALLSAYGPVVGIPIERIGALLVAWDEEQRARLPEIAANARAVGYGAAREIAGADLARFEPHLGPGATGALAIPDEAIICPFTTPLAFATEAVLNGATLALGTAVTGRRAGAEATHVLGTARGDVHADWVVNAAGLGADELDRLFGHDDFTRDSAARRAHRLRQARASARASRAAAGPDGANEGRAGEPDRLRQRRARADGRGRTGQARDRVDPRRPRAPRRAGPAARAGARRRGGDGGLRRAPRRDASTATMRFASSRASATCASAASGRPGSRRRWRSRSTCSRACATRA